MINDKIQKVRAGQPISAADMNELIANAKRLGGRAGSFISGAVEISRAVSVESAAAAAAGGALAVVKGTVPASSAIDVTGTLADDASVATIGLLAVDATDDTFTEGACVVDYDGYPVFVDGVLKALPVINPAFSDFIGEGDGVLVAGSIITDDDDNEYFILPRFELRTEDGWVLGTDAEDDAQALYHEGSSRAQKVGREDCEDTGGGGTSSLSTSLTVGLGA